MKYETIDAFDRKGPQRPIGWANLRLARNVGRAVEGLAVDEEAGGRRREGCCPVGPMEGCAAES